MRLGACQGGDYVDEAESCGFHVQLGFGVEHRGSGDGSNGIGEEEPGG